MNASMSHAQIIAAALPKHTPDPWDADFDAPLPSPFDAAPQKLRDIAHWLDWRLGKNKDGRLTKHPYNARTGKISNAHAESTWLTFSEAVTASADYDGIGFSFAKTTLVGIDLDGVVNDGEIQPFAADIIKIANTYAEYSPSGNGVHLILESEIPLPKGNRKGTKQLGGEIYDASSPRYFTVSGNKIAGLSRDDVRRVDDILVIEVLHCLVLHLHDEKFTALWMGDTSRHHGNESEADLALCGLLARHFNNDYTKVLRAMQFSKLWDEKWERPDYQERTVGKACGKTTEPLSEPQYTKTTDSKAAEHPILAKAREHARLFDKQKMVFDPNGESKIEVPIFDGFMMMGDFVVWLGAKKTEKSIFSLRLAMHEACGKTFYGYRCTRPYRVSYLDAENGEITIRKRYNALLEEFTSDEQALIRANLLIIDGEVYRRAGGTLDYLNDDFWNWYTQQSRDAEIHVLDCLYMLHSLEAFDNNGLQEVMDVLRYRFSEIAEGRTIVILNHTRSMSNDDLRANDHLSLERLGAQNFSEQSYGGKVLLKYATLVICIDKQFQRDENDEVISDEVHLQFYGREAPSPLMKFETTDGMIGRQLIRTLSSGAKQAAVELRMKRGESGKWASRHDAAQDLRCARSSAYKHLDELILKECLVADDHGILHLRISAALAVEISIAKEQAANYRTACDWLRSYVVHPMEAENVLIAGEELNYGRDDLSRARKEIKLVEEAHVVNDKTIILWRPQKKRGIASGKAKELAQRRWALEPEVFESEAPESK